MIAKAPAEKLPLAVRKNVRDEFEDKRNELEQRLSELLHESWKIEVNPNLIYAYAEEGSYGNTSLGSCLYAYFDGAIDSLKYFLDSRGHGKEGIKEINTHCSKHTMTLAPDEGKRFSYCGADIKDGMLRIIFAEGNLGTNVSYALSELEPVLNSASISASADSLSYTVRHSIKEDWQPKAEELQQKIGEQLHNPNIKLTPQFEQIYTAMKGAKDADQSWESRVGMVTYCYYEALLGTLQYNKFKDDDLLYEGFAEAAPKGEITLRVVSKLTGSSSYNQTLIEDDVLVLQTVPSNFGVNSNDIAQKLVDIL